MTILIRPEILRAVVGAFIFAVLSTPALAQRGGRIPARTLAQAPSVFDSAEGRIRVAVVTNELDHPWSLAFLPNGDMLVTELPGRLRILRDGVLDPTPISGVPEVAGTGGLLEVGLHPEFETNQLVYLTYTKPLAEGDHTPTLIRGRLDGMTLVDVEELFEARTQMGGPPAGAPMIFGPDGFVYMGIGGANDAIAQDTMSHQGKIVRWPSVKISGR
jgi:glucose/arabinose dehydrogenase